MPISPVNPGPVFADTSYQNASRGSEATARQARESEDRPQATVPEANQRISPNQGGSEANSSGDNSSQGERGRLDIYV
ncbi:hypothetical protein [Thiohalorhabdus sp.]|uniref:hypothetical protein n=1 Tax=Thiohalorhabdus sp. TaxID=3094134 RepID=UPI002FC3B4D3